MKKRFLTIEQAGVLYQYRNEKFTTGLIVGAIVTAVAGLGAAGINAASQSAANSANMQLNAETLEEQIKLFHEANEFNHDEALINRDFNAAEAAKAREFQAGMLDKQLEYQSAKSQVQRYLDAGLNPASLAGNVQSGGFSLPSGNPASSSPASSASTPSLPVARVNPVNYGDFAKVLGDAVNNGLSMSQGFEDTKTKVTFNDYYQEILESGLNVSRQQARVLWNQYNQISADIAATNKSIDKIVSDIGLQEKQGKWYDKQGDLITQQELSYHIDNIFKGEHWQKIIEHEAVSIGLDKLHARYYAAFVQSEIAKNYGAAAYSNALTNLAEVEKTFKEKGMKDELESIHHMMRVYKNQANLLNVEYQVASETKGKKIEAEIEHLEWMNSNWMKASEFMKNITTPIATAGALYLGARGAKGALGSSTVKGTQIVTSAPKGSVPGLQW